MSISVDVTGAQAKIETMKNLGRAGLYQLTDFGAKAIYAIKTAGILGTRTGQLMRNIDMDVQPGPPARLILGTGVGKAKSVKYASIHEEGGEIRPKGHPFLTIPLPGVRGTAANYPNATLGITAQGQWLLLQPGTGPKGGGFRVLFLLRRMVKIPARHWFSRPLQARRSELDRMLAAEELYRIADKLH